MNPLQLFAMLPDRPSFEESFIYQMTGLIVVFTALGMIWLCLTLVGKYFKKTASAAVVVPAVGGKVVVEPSPDEISPELVAVIAASVQLTIDSPFRIQAIVPVRSGQDWATEGRRRIFSSHTVR